jgi:hypothetical protein
MILARRSIEVSDALLDEVRQTKAADLDAIQRHKEYQRNVWGVKNPPPYVPHEDDVLAQARQIARLRVFTQALREVIAQRPKELQQEIDKLPLDGNKNPIMTGSPDEARLVELCQQWCDEIRAHLGSHISVGASLHNGEKGYELALVHSYEWAAAENCIDEF